MKIHQILAATLMTLLAMATNTSTIKADETPAPTVFNVRTYGATGDGSTLDQAAINKAIDAASAAGGGTVWIGGGKYLCGSIHMKSNINLYLDAGAEIIGAPKDSPAYDVLEPFSQGTVGGQPIAYQDGGHCYFHNSLIWGENLTNVSITGHGTINGGGMVSGDGLLDKLSGFSNFGKETPSAPPATDPATVHLGNKAIALKLCRNVTIRDVTIFHGGHFAILVTGCDDMTVDNVTMDTNRDGIDIDCCRNTVVSNCRINSPNDDGLCPKSTYALGENRIEENLTITNCQVSGFAEGTLLDGTMKPSKNQNGRIKFGTESSGGYRNVTISNCTFRGCRGLALEEVDGGVMENISINNITMMDVPSYAIYVTTGKRNRTGNLEAPSRCRNIVISNVIGTNIAANSGIQLMGLPEQPLEGIRLENIRLTFDGGGTKEQGAKTPRELGTGYPEPKGLGVMPGYGLVARHVKDLELANIRFDTVKPDERPAIALFDIDGLDLNGFKAPMMDGIAAARFEAVKGDAILNSPVLTAEGAITRQTELSTPPPEEPRKKREKGAASAPAATE